MRIGRWGGWEGGEKAAVARRWFVRALDLVRPLRAALNCHDTHAKASRIVSRSCNGDSSNDVSAKLARITSISSSSDKGGPVDTSSTPSSAAPADSTRLGFSRASASNTSREATSAMPRSVSTVSGLERRLIFFRCTIPHAGRGAQRLFRSGSPLSVSQSSSRSNLMVSRCRTREELLMGWMRGALAPIGRSAQSRS